MKLGKTLTKMPLLNSFRGKIKFKNKSGLLIKCKIKSKGNGNEIIIGNNCVFKRCSFTLLGNNCKVLFDDNVFAQNAAFFIEDDNGIIRVGSDTSFAGKIHIACTEGAKIIIGRDCLFSSEITIRNGDSHSIFNINSDERINFAKDVIICDHIWVGNRAMINKGVLISSNSIVGNGAIVTNQFTEMNVVLAGVPARIVKRGVNWNAKRN
ncbi:acyltransferase [bacterium]|nr:acyltransferase [bacterium]